MTKKPKYFCYQVEGADGAGKSTLVLDISRRLNLPVIPTENPPVSWEECRARVRARFLPGVICDRSSGLISELVYGPVLRGGTIGPEDWYWETFGLIAPFLVLVYCEARGEFTFRPDEDPSHVQNVKDRIENIHSRYREVFQRVEKETQARVIRYNWKFQTVEEVTQLCAD